MRNWKPIYIENSRILAWLSYLAPISIQAITLGVIVISKDEMSEVTKNHETIHFQQYLETLFLGFLILYFWDWFIGLVKYKDGQTCEIQRWSKGIPVYQSRTRSPQKPREP